MKQRQPAMAGRFRIGHREDRDQVGHRTVADEPLGPADHVVVAVADGAGAGGGDIGAGLGLGQGERDQGLPARQLREPAGLLLRRAGEQQRQRAELLDGQDQPGRGAGAAELLDGEADRQQLAAEAAVFLGKRQGQDVLGGEELAQVLGELAGPVDLRGAGRDPLVGELADGIAQELLLLGQPVRAVGWARRGHVGRS